MSRNKREEGREASCIIIAVAEDAMMLLQVRGKSLRINSLETPKTELQKSITRKRSKWLDLGELVQRMYLLLEFHETFIRKKGRGVGGRKMRRGDT